MQYTGHIPIICAKYTDVKDYAIDMPYLANMTMNKNTAYDKFDDNTEIDWVVATSVSDGMKKLVPAFMVFMYDVDLKGTLFGPTSNGAAAGLTVEDAILHGLLEVVERDALLIGQCNSYVLPIVDHESINNPKLKETISKIESLGYDVITRDYTNNLGIPIFRTWLVNKNNYSQYAYYGLGCHISPELALERSITEAVQTNDRTDYGGDIGSDSLTQAILKESLVNLYNQHHLVNKDILGRTDKSTTIGKPIFDMDSSGGIIKKLSEHIKKKINGDVYYVDLTKPGMNIKVVRTIITGEIQHMNEPLILVSNRMFEFGIRCGYSTTESSYEELFVGDYAD